MSVRGTLGGANVATASGDVLLESLAGGLNVKSASGDTRAREIAGGVNVQTASGDVELDVVRGAINVASASGDVTIGEAWDNVNVNTVSGDQEHGAVYQGNVSAHAVSGDVSVGVRRGSKVFLDCNTVSGDTSSELDMLPDAPSGDGPLVELRVKTVSGDIDITRAPAPADTRRRCTHEPSLVGLNGTASPDRQAALAEPASRGSRRGGGRADPRRLGQAAAHLTVLSEGARQPVQREGPPGPSRRSTRCAARRTPAAAPRRERLRRPRLAAPLRVPQTASPTHAHGSPASRTSASSTPASRASPPAKF